MTPHRYFTGHRSECKLQFPHLHKLELHSELTLDHFCKTSFSENIKICLLKKIKKQYFPRIASIPDDDINLFWWLDSRTLYEKYFSNSIFVYWNIVRFEIQMTGFQKLLFEKKIQYFKIWCLRLMVTKYVREFKVN